jgi:hypothetical protein
MDYNSAANQDDDREGGKGIAASSCNSWHSFGGDTGCAVHSY